jgi:hypothetical protein
MHSIYQFTRIMCLLFAALAFGMPVRAQTARLRTDPLALGVKPGSQSSLSIVFDHVEQLYGLEVHLSFDPAVIQVVDANPAITGVQVEQASWLKDAFIATNKVDNKHGTIDFAAMLLSPAEPVSGRRPALTFKVQGVQDGSTPLSINDAILVSQDGMLIPTEVQSGIVSVSSSGKAPTSGMNGKSASSGEAASVSSDHIPILIMLAAVLLVAVALVSSLALYAAKERRSRV